MFHLNILFFLEWGLKILCWCFINMLMEVGSVFDCVSFGYVKFS